MSYWLNEAISNLKAIKEKVKDISTTPVSICELSEGFIQIISSAQSAIYGIEKHIEVYSKKEGK